VRVLDGTDGSAPGRTGDAAETGDRA
jgi:hypothetical protein